MSTSLWVEGKIDCTLINLRGFSGTMEKGSASFKGTHPEAQIRFSGGATFDFTLKVTREEYKSPLTTFTNYSRKGDLSFRVFPGSQKTPYNGSKTFSLDLIKEKQDVNLGDIVILDGGNGGVGRINVKLFFEEITG